MNIVEAILIDRKKYVVLISGFIWWDYFNTIIDALSSNFNFDVVHATLLSNNKLITSADQINFIKLNEDVKAILDRNKNNNKANGVFVVSYTFPPERLDIPVDFHININVSQSLLSTIIASYLKETGQPRLDMDAHLSYLAKSWKNNKINKYVTYQSDYTENQDVPYSIIFEAIADNIMKKVYGEKYEEIKANSNNTDDKKIINMSNQTELSLVDLAKINTATNYGKFVAEVTDIIENSEQSNDFEDDDKNEIIELLESEESSNKPSTELGGGAAFGKIHYIGIRKKSA
jgi:hypothetical protein